MYNLGLGGSLARGCFFGGFPCVGRVVIFLFGLFACMRCHWLAKGALIVNGTFGHQRPKMSLYVNLVLRDST